jgi:hypothetical protein
MQQAGNQRVREKAKTCFLVFRQELKIIFKEFIIANRLDDGVADAKRILPARSLSRHVF